MIHVEYVGRFGNNLHQYALGRIIHEATGWQFSTYNCNRDLRERYSINIDRGEPRFQNQEFFSLPSFIPGKELPDPIRIREHDFADVAELISVGSARGTRGIILHGFFQRWKYFLPHRDKIREWFTLKNDALQNLKVPDDQWVIHVRHGDYLDGGHNLPFDYYRKVIKQIPAGARIVFVGDADKEFLRVLCALRAKDSHIGTGLPEDSISDFAFIRAHKNIVCSNSTFSWWASFLSDAEQVYIPRPAAPKYWHAGSAQDLYIPNSNHILVEC